MRIDRTSGFELYGPAGKDKNPPKGASHTRGSGLEQGLDVTISEPEKKYFSQVRAIDEVNIAAVSEAKKLLAAGQLDTPQAIENVAKTLIERGI